MEKLIALVSDFDDTLFFNREAIILAAKDLHEIVEREKKGEEDCKTLSDLEIISRDGKIPKDFSKPWKSQLYTFAYGRYGEKLTPNKPIIRYLNERAERERSETIILSARGEEFRRQTKELLDTYGLRYNKIILPDNHYLKDEEWKLLEVEKLSKEYHRILLFEDKLDNIKYIENNLNSKNIEFYLVNRSFIINVTGQLPKQKQ